MFNNHTMTMVTDLNTLGGDINNADFICVAAITNDNNFNHLPNIYNASILSPPTEILMRWADGDPLIMQNEYPRYLSMNEDADSMIVALLAALTKKNVVLYISRSEFDIFGQILLNHLYFVYGITVNTPISVFSFNTSKLPFIISKFYMMDLMEAKDFIESYPPNMQLPPFVINKLAAELQPFNRPATFAEYADYFNRMVASSMKTNKIMIKRVD